jgi:hypothetical protein
VDPGANALHLRVAGGRARDELPGPVWPPLIGIRATFWFAGGLICVIFLATTFLIREERPARTSGAGKLAGAWSQVGDRRPIVAMLVTGMLLMFAVMSAWALGSILSASWPGKLADHVGHWNVLTGGLVAAALLLTPRAFVTAAWQRVVLRFLMGLALGGLLPCATSVIRHSSPARCSDIRPRRNTWAR